MSPGTSQPAAAWKKKEAGESAELSLGALAEITHTLGLLFLCCGSF